MKNNQKKQQKEKPVSKVREEFGLEFTGDMNADRIYDILLSGKEEKRK
jgi:hypothetical protein